MKNLPLTYQKLYREIQQPDEQIDLAKSVLLFAFIEYPDLDIAEYLNQLDAMATEVKKRLTKAFYPLKILQTMNQYLFEDLRYRGNTQDYYDVRNSYLNQVIERRTGIPISLSIIYLEMAKRIDFPMVGIGMPGHFLIRPNFEEVGIFVDVFNQGEILFEQDCEALLSQIYQQSIKLQSGFLEPITNHQILTRTLNNLKYIYINQAEYEKAIITIDLVLLLLPNHPLELRDRGLLHYQLAHWKQATNDLELYLQLLPTAQDAEAIRQLLAKINLSSG